MWVRFQYANYSNYSKRGVLIGFYRINELGSCFEHKGHLEYILRVYRIAMLEIAMPVLVGAGNAGINTGRTGDCCL